MTEKAGTQILVEKLSVECFVTPFSKKKHERDARASVAFCLLWELFFRFWIGLLFGEANDIASEGPQREYVHYNE